MEIRIELDVDFIGGQGPGSLTIEEEKALNSFFKKRKLNKVKAHKKTPAAISKRNEFAISKKSKV